MCTFSLIVSKERQSGCAHRSGGAQREPWYVLYTMYVWCAL